MNTPATSMSHKTEMHSAITAETIQAKAAELSSTTLSILSQTEVELAASSVAVRFANRVFHGETDAKDFTNICKMASLLPENELAEVLALPTDEFQTKCRRMADRFAAGAIFAAQAGAEQAKTPLPKIVGGADFMKIEFPVRPAVIINVAHAGEVLTYAAPSKGRKTFAMMLLALAICNGGKWLGHQCNKGRVLYIALENFADNIQKRFREISNASGYDITNDVALWTLRGKAHLIEQILEELVVEVKRGGYSTVIVDPGYKLLNGADENNNSEVTQLMVTLERVCMESSALLIIPLHYTKGSSSGKDIIDRAAGAGSWSRSADAILTCTPHALEDCFTLEMVLRDQPPMGGSVIEWQHPTFKVRGDLDPADLKQPAKKKVGKMQKCVVNTEDTAVLSEMKQGEFYSGAEIRHRLSEVSGIDMESCYTRLTKLVCEKSLIQVSARKFRLPTPAETVKNPKPQSPEQYHTDSYRK